MLELTGYFQSVTVGVAPVVVVIASVATFSTHMLLGYDLTAAQVPKTKTNTCNLSDQHTPPGFSSCSAAAFLT